MSIAIRDYLDMQSTVNELRELSVRTGCDDALVGALLAQAYRLVSQALQEARAVAEYECGVKANEHRS